MAAKNHINSGKIVKFVLLSLIVLISFIQFKKFFVWMVLSLIAAGIKYYRIRYYGQIPLVPEPVLFVSSVLTRGYGFKWSLYFLLGPNVFGELLTGGFQFTMFIGIFKFIMYQVINLILSDVNLFIVGLLLCLLDIIIDYFLNTFVWGLPPFFMIYPISQIVFHTLYFSILTQPVLAILGATV